MNRREIIEQDMMRFERVAKLAFIDLEMRERERLLLEAQQCFYLYADARLKGDEREAKIQEKRFLDCTKTVNYGHELRCPSLKIVTIACDESDGSALDVYDEFDIDFDEVEAINTPLVIARQHELYEFIYDRKLNLFGLEPEDLAKRFTEYLLEQPDPTPKAIEDGTDPIFCLVDVPEPWVEHLEYNTPIEEPMDGELEAFEEFKSEFTYVDVARDKEPYFGTLEQMPWLKGTIQPCICKRKEKE